MGENNYLAQSPIQSVKAEVIFGKLSHDCRGVGICKVDVKRRRNSSCKHCKFRAEAEVRLFNDGKIVFHFDRKRLREQVRLRHLRRDEFIVPEAFHFQPDLLAALNLQQHCIKPGVYRINETEDGFEIAFDKAEMNYFQSKRVHYFIRRRTRQQRQLVAVDQ